MIIHIVSVLSNVAILTNVSVGQTMDNVYSFSFTRKDCFPIPHSSAFLLRSEFERWCSAAISVVACDRVNRSWPESETSL